MTPPAGLHRYGATVYPAVTPRTSGFVDTEDGQRLYWEEAGNPDRLPTLYLHGGPGSGLGEGYRSRYDPARYRTIGLDQRGCGRSRPLAEQALDRLDDNTTAHQLHDLERLRTHLGVEQWQVTGVSWGSTLALAYAQAFPERVHSIVLVAVTSSSRAEIEWVTESMRSIYPDHWDEFAAHAERAGVGYARGEGRVIDAYAALSRSPDPAVRAAAASAWCRWEDVPVSVGPGWIRRRLTRRASTTRPSANASPCSSRTTGATTASAVTRSSTGWRGSRTSLGCWYTDVPT